LKNSLSGCEKQLLVEHRNPETEDMRFALNQIV
jgi:hypothetical protein